MQLQKIIMVCLVTALSIQSANAQDLEDKATTLDFAGFPGLNYTSDGGFGFGAIGSMYGRTKDLKPYRFAVDLQVFASTKGQQSHFLRMDWLELFDLPLRLLTRLTYVATSNQNFCGLGAWADCDVGPANNENYFLVRYSEKSARAQARYRIKDAPSKIELTASYRGSIYIPGSLDTSTPYPGSLFEAYSQARFSEKGFASVFGIGVMFDTRDAEASPTSGYWAEASMRESSRFLGSDWQFLGGNVTARGYLSLDVEKRLVFASQFIMDAIVGDAPLQEIVRVGNSQEFTAFGGSEIGRGLREQYFPGRLKLMQQLELRYRFIEFTLFSQNLSLSTLAFGDFGLVSWRIENLETEPKKAMFGFGSGLRLAWNTDFVVRLDLGFSPIESYSPKIYIKIGNVF